MSNSRFTSSQPYRIMIDARVKMRDGVELSADVYLPPEGGPFPTLLVRTIYDNQAKTTWRRASDSWRAATPW